MIWPLWNDVMVVQYVCVVENRYNAMAHDGRRRWIRVLRKKKREKRKKKERKKERKKKDTSFSTVSDFFFRSLNA